jgi:hypothetical protein
LGRHFPFSGLLGCLAVPVKGVKDVGKLYEYCAKCICLTLCFSVVGIHLTGYPISYFNFVQDEDKSAYLLDSNIDWGQSAYEIKEWCDTHVEARPRYISYTRTVPFNRMAVVDDGNFPEYARKPGWLIISVNDICNEKYKWLHKEKPVEILGGGSVFIYYLEP